MVEKHKPKDAIRQLFEDDAEIALFYFTRDGYIEDTSGFLCASDCETGDDGLALSEVMTLANRSGAKNKVIILDSCHSGAVWNNVFTKVAEISTGETILTASTADQYSLETPGGGSESSRGCSLTRSTVCVPRITSRQVKRYARIHGGFRLAGRVFARSDW